jgi:site-specific recombinase XerD
MTAVAAIALPADPAWSDIAARAPKMATTMGRYLEQIAVSLRPSSVTVNDHVLRMFAAHIIATDPKIRSVARIGRVHVEDYKRALAARRTRYGTTLSANTIRQRLGCLRTFFERIIEWDYDDAPARVPVYASDLPKADEPLPRFLDDPTAARLLRAAANDPDPFRRLVVELLARTGLRVSELCGLEAEAVTRMHGGWWLRVPVGKLHNDRYVPLHPQLVEQLADWAAREPANDTGLLLHRRGRPLDRHIVGRILDRVAKAGGVGHVSPHQLRHTLATQAINRGMRLEAIADLLGHRSLRMTMRYARIANRTVADEYHAVADQVDALYGQPRPLRSDRNNAAQRRIRQEQQRRLLGNGYCGRPAELDCTFESICETCVHFQTGPDFVPVLLRQRDHAAERNQTGRRDLFDRLLTRLDPYPA